MNYRRIGQALEFIILLGVVALFIIQAFPGSVGADYALIVKSGSMEPAISTGSVVLVEAVPPERVDERIEEGDVITYNHGGNIRGATTHRVIKKETGDISNSVRFITKGDANEDADPEPVHRGDVIGEVMFSIPYIGYVVSLGGTTAGFGLLVVLPVTLLLMDGLWQIYLAFEPEQNKE